MKTRTFVLPVLLAAALSACATTQSRIRKHQAEFDSYPPAVQQKIKDGKVEVGFTQQQAAMALGKPDRIYRRKTADSDQEVWAYGIGGGRTSVGFGFGMWSGGPVSIGTGVDFGPEAMPSENLRIVFQGGTVVSVESRER
jgi:hypothetical protein